MSTDSDIDFAKFQQFLNLGMKASVQHPSYKTLARLSPQYAEALYVLKNWEKLRKVIKENPIRAGELILYNFGLIDGLNRFGELTHLSMIVGDTTEKKSAKHVKEKLQKLRELSERGTPEGPKI